MSNDLCVCLAIKRVTGENKSFPGFVKLQQNSCEV